MVGLISLAGPLSDGKASGRLRTGMTVLVRRGSLENSADIPAGAHAFDGFCEHLMSGKATSYIGAVKM